MTKVPFPATLLCLVALFACSSAQTPPPSDGFVTETVVPQRVVCTSGPVNDPQYLLDPYCGQVSTDEDRETVFSEGGSVVLDYGKELQGGVRIVRSMYGSHKAAKFRLVFGESVSEALSSVSDAGTTATNDHSVRDCTVEVPWLGSVEFGSSGFRFVRLELIDGDGEDVALVAVEAVSRKRDIQYQGSFSCSDEVLTRVWQTGAYTVHLCMQDYLWDGVKRDRLVWMGDMHPEVMTVNTVFGNQGVVQKSLDYVRDKTAPGGWMNGISSYSLWWIIIQHHLYSWYGDFDYLKEQKEYLEALLEDVVSEVEDGWEAYGDGRFIDWPSNDKPAVIHAGLQALTVRALSAGASLMEWLGEPSFAIRCQDLAKEMRSHVPGTDSSSQAAALLSLEGMLDAGTASELILENGPEKFTSFMGYYLLEALARSGHYAEAMDMIKAYWGRMLELGATTFWEDFNYSDASDAAPIDEVVPEGKFDIHADGGAWCYVGLRQSLCHGWASGPTAWLSAHVLGIEPVGIGMKKVRIEPHLGNLDWAEGTFPTPYGIISVRHQKRPDGSIESKVRLPKGVTRVESRSAPSKTTETLEVMSFNVRYGSAEDGDNVWKNRREAAAAMIMDRHPAVFGVQEALDFQLTYFEENCPGYKYVGVGREDGDHDGEHMAVFYDTERLELRDWGTYWLSDTPDVPSYGWDAACKRTATWTLMKDKATGRLFFFVNTHLDHVGAEARKNGLLLLVEKIGAMNPEGYPMVLTGDMNVYPEDPCLVALRELMEDARETAPVTDNGVTWHDWGKEVSGPPIDYVFYSGFAGCSRFRTVRKSYKGVDYVSDHYPVTATLRYED